MPISLTTGVDESLPNELLTAILQELKGDFSTLFHVASTCMILKSEAESLLYQSLCYKAPQQGLSARFRNELNSNVGPPPRSYIDNPSLAKHLQNITYVESSDTPPSEDMRMVLSAAYSNILPRLKFLEVTLHCGVPHGFMTHGRFQLNVLRLAGSSFPANLSQILKRQKALKGLRVTPGRTQLAAIPPSVVAHLETLEGPFHVLEALLPSRKVKTLVWEPDPSNEGDRNKNIARLSEQLSNLTTLSYPISKYAPPFRSVVQYLRNLKYLVVNDAWAFSARNGHNGGDFMEELTEILAKLPLLCGLVLTSNNYGSRTLSASIPNNCFQECPALQFLDVEHSETPKVFDRWVRGQDKYIVWERSVRYRRLPDDIVENYLMDP